MSGASGDGDAAAGESGKRSTLTNLDKVFWPAERYTKGDLLDYYRAIAPWMLPYLKDRPLVLTRFPDGIAGKSFFQKDAPSWAPDWLRTEALWSEHGGREIHYFVCDSVEALLYVANMGAIPLHVWSSRVADLARPDWCILDIDPKGAAFAGAVAIARSIRSLCEAIELPTFVKTSGSEGIHVLVPLGGQMGFEQSRRLAELVAQVVVAELPEIATRRARAEEARRQGLSRHAPERSRQTARSALLRATAARRAGLDAAALERGERAPRPTPLHDPQRGGADETTRQRSPARRARHQAGSRRRARAPDRAGSRRCALIGAPDGRRPARRSDTEAQRDAASVRSGEGARGPHGAALRLSSAALLHAGVLRRR